MGAVPMEAANPTPVPPDESRPSALAERGTTLHDLVHASAWKARGLTKVLGAVDVGDADLEGTVVVGGPFTADSVSVRGTLEVRGMLTVRGELSLHGTLRAGGATAGSARLAGVVRADGPIATQGTLVARGSVSAPAVTGREVHLNGVVRVPGEVRADEVDLELAERSEVGTVFGRKARIFGPDGGAIDRLLGRYRHAHVERVEADALELERVEVTTVIAREAVLGRDAHVARLDVSKLKSHATSRVGPESRTAPPKGLRR
jgi:cytoskeletal protein CcmA (bactofilin family)